MTRLDICANSYFHEQNRQSEVQTGISFIYQVLLQNSYRTLDLLYVFAYYARSVNLSTLKLPINA